MQRTSVQIVRMRITDLVPGDVANTNPDATRGWFVVHEVRRLTNGDFSVSDATERNSLNGAGSDIVGVQIDSLIEAGEKRPDAAAAPAQPSMSA